MNHLETINRMNGKTEQLKRDLPSQIASSNRIEPEVLLIDSWSNHITIKLKGMLTDKAIETIESDGFRIKGIAARHSVISVLVENAKLRW